jgi:Fe-S oxidoreductase
MATRDEEHSTRGRANALRLALSGQLGPDALTSRRLYDVLDLCLSCKACQSECPSRVDMARLKSEFLQGYHDRHGATLRDRLFANPPGLSGPLAPLANLMLRNRVFRQLLEAGAGIDRRRVLPLYTISPFQRWFDRRPIRTTGTREVVLFDDCFLSRFDPHIGRAAVELLESCGYHVRRAGAGCCQRPRITHGFLRAAKTEGGQTLRRLDPFIRGGLDIVVCEPGCASALTDDLPDLADDEELGCRVSAGVTMLDMFLIRELNAGRLAASFSSPARKILVHGHCHQKVLFGTKAMKEIWARVPGLTVSEVDSGCCGMAGAFGYEKEHFDLSQKIGERRLFPAVRAAGPGVTVVACGFSCRHQIRDATGVNAAHFVETVRGGL